MDDKKKKAGKNLTVVTNGRATAEEVRSPAVCDEDVPHMLASASSPSLLTGCGDPSTPAGFRIERHCQLHHIHTGSCVTSPEAHHPPVQVVEFPATPSPLLSPILSPQVQGSNIFTPPPPRCRTVNTQPERPSSAPPYRLQRISGLLLRLVGDHYLCLTCGRELRTIGDQLALETDLRRAFASSCLHDPNREQSEHGPH
ncbi:hypothetical protein PoB_004789600 [Plakobranchus ocellatus]|uniref:Uncharacterized protein n=1 Tax=Plakobranchus ocellatus TaxID=259542 RepID=A0AAV4BQQ5_9GAST|nr:hypothetical protein PoB_004789600 [Plakobranchus ocellatus]